MNNPIKFGTDGWRAVIAGGFTLDNVRLCAQGAAAYLKNAGLAKQGVMIGYDHHDLRFLRNLQNHALISLVEARF